MHPQMLLVSADIESNIRIPVAEEFVYILKILEQLLNLVPEDNNKVLMPLKLY